MARVIRSERCLLSRVCPRGPLARERSADESDGACDVAGDERCRDAENAPPSAAQELIAVSIQLSAREVHPAVYFYDEPRRRAGKIRDETPDDELPAEGNAELAAAELSPEPLLRERWVLAHALSMSLELELTMARVSTMMTR